MRRVFNKLILAIVTLSIAAALLASCSALYPSPDSVKASEALGDAIWPSRIPAPSFIGMYLGKYLDFTSDPINPDSAVIAFLHDNWNDVVKYAKFLRTKGFTVTGVVLYYSEGDYARAARQSFNNANYYEAVKGSLEVKIWTNSGIVEIRISGLTAAEIAALNAKSMSDEWDVLSSSIAAQGEAVRDISKSFGKNEGSEGIDTDGIWPENLPVPAFISKVGISDWDVGKTGVYREKPDGSYGWGYSVQFYGLSPSDINGYLSLLKNRGGKIYKTNLYRYFPDAEPGGYHAIERVKEAYFANNTLADDTLSWIKVDVGGYSLYISVEYQRMPGENGAGIYGPDYQSNGGYTFEIFGFSEEALDALVIKAGSRWTDGRFSRLVEYALSNDIIDFDKFNRLQALLSERDIDSLLADETVSALMTDEGCLEYVSTYNVHVPFVPEDHESEYTNHSPYTSDQVHWLLISAFQRGYITPDEWNELGNIMLVDMNIDKVLEHEGMKKALADEECLIESGIKE